MTNLEKKNLLSAMEGKTYGTIDAMREEITRQLNLLGLGVVKDCEDAYEAFHIVDEEVGMEDIHENICCNFDCFVNDVLISIVVKEYYVDSGSVDYYYAFEEY